MKRDWNIYFGTTNRYGIKICSWLEENESHTKKDKVICICPECGKYFTTSIETVVYETKTQTKRCQDCAFKKRGLLYSEKYSGITNEKSRRYDFNIGDIVNDNLLVENIFYKNKSQWLTVKCLLCGDNFDIKKTNTTKNNPVKACRKCAYKLTSENIINKNKLEHDTIYGLLKILCAGEPFVKNGKHYSTSVCECACGNIVTVRNSLLKSGQTKSCGCLKSWLEAQTAKFLVLNGITFTHGLRFSAILTDNGNPVEFDFQIEDEFNNHICFIECQGEQHYKDKGDFGRQQRDETDIKKKNYCKEYNILLYEIRYDENVEQRVREILTELNLI